MNRFLIFVILSVLPCLASAHKADYYPPELFEMTKTGFDEEMQKLYDAEAPIEDIAFMQKWLVDEAAKFAGLPDYRTISRIVSSQILCTRKAEQKPKSIRVINCLDRTCENCSEARAQFYEYLKTKVWMSEWALYTTLRQ